MRTLVLGDVHGAYRALVQVMDRCNFNPEQDDLIFLGDVADGWPDTWECVDWLFQNADDWVLGNHDRWANEWISTGIALPEWLSQGGQATLDSYIKHGVSDDQMKYYRMAKKYTIREVNGDTCIFTHGGFNPRSPVENQILHTFMWDRNLWHEAVQREAGWQLSPNEPNPKKLSHFDKIFIGHTALGGDHVPLQMCNVYNIDTGAGWAGKLTVYCVETDEYWQSDFVKELYDESKGRE